jgi:hypothetical protein
MDLSEPTRDLEVVLDSVHDELSSNQPPMAAHRNLDHTRLATSFDRVN